MKFIRGTNGHAFATTKTREEFGDLRTSKRNRCARTNMRNRDGERERIAPDRAQNGCAYDDERECTTCCQLLPRSHFMNMAVMAINRGKCGLNIQCRYCQTRKYSCGYLRDDFVVDDDEIEYW